MSRMRFTSFDSRCFSFDDRVNGSDAVKNNDTIRAAVHSTGSIEDYYTPGIAQPSREDLARLIWSTYEKASLDVSSIRYVEAHGTGTPIGDPIEDGAIGCVFHAYRSLHGDVDEHRSICLTETNSSLFSNLKGAYRNPNFDLSRGNGMLWVTQSRSTASSWPGAQMVTGLARVLRFEDPNRPFVTLSLKDEVDSLEMIAQYL
ncbi:hypothetical protein B5807_10514 [Epicoccum nigrum]|uniref:Ketosynthase family 3 (KS3) domain-containing protein n=1 Tax=Epicoccum nigrum TaxID=105696 RepID=A0A1Y2LME0_EPING|nr:hypothetical protein B5807_10514 [Epicoccum nigrum]